MASKFKTALSFFAKKKYKEEQPSHIRSFFGMSGGTFITPDTAMKVAAFNRGIIYISTQIAKLPWEIKDASKTVLDNDRLVKLLNLSPNPEMNAMFFKLWMTQLAIIKGNSYAEIERDVIGRPVALWPLNPDHVVLERLATGQLFYRIINGRTSGGDSFLRTEDVYHIKNFHTLDGLNGQGIVAYAIETLGIAAGADKFANSLMANGGLPSGVLESDTALTAEAAARIKESWVTGHTGRKAGGTAILEEGLKYKPISFGPDVLQFLESRKFSVIEIARFLGLPPTKLYATEAANYSNIENSNIEVAVDTLDAWARNFEIEANVKLLNNSFGGKFSEMDLSAVFRGDSETRGNYFSKMVSMSAMTPNQVRNKEGLPGYKGGDRYYIAANNFSPVDRIDELVDAQIKSKETPAPTPQQKKDHETKQALLNKLIEIQEKRA